MTRSFEFFMLFHLSQLVLNPEFPFKGAGEATDLKINKSTPLSLNHHILSNNDPTYTKKVSYDPC